MLIVIGFGAVLLGLRRLWAAYEERAAVGSGDTPDRVAGVQPVPARVHALQAAWFLSIAGLLLSVAFDRTIAAAIFGAAVGGVAVLLAVRVAVIILVSRRSRPDR